MTDVRDYDMPFLLTTAGATLNVAGLLYFDWRLNVVGLVPSLVGVLITHKRLPT